MGEIILRRNMVIGLALLVLLSILPIGVVGSRQEKVPVIIMFKDKPDVDLVRSHGGEIKYVYIIIPAIAASVPPRGIEGLKRSLKIAYVEVDIDKYYVEQTLPWGIDRIDAEFAHAVGVNGSEVRVAVLDTGIDKDHPDLREYWGYSVVSTDPGDYDDRNGHGTHVSGIIAALDNDIGVVGVAPSVWLYAIQISKGPIIKESDIIAGIEWAVKGPDGVIDSDVDGEVAGDPDDDAARVISMSFGGGASDAEREALHKAYYEYGVLLVAAAGNDGSDAVIYPAGYEFVIAVSSTDKDDGLSSFSNYGDHIELAAPGREILSTYKGGGYETLSGTSMATPHVSGVAALIFSTSIIETYDADGDGKWDASEVRKRLWDTAEDLGPAGKDKFYGYGLVDAENATLGTTNGDNLVTPVGNLEGYVTDSTDGSAIEGATVTVVGTAKSATTDSTGYYLIEGIPEGTYDVTAEAEGYVSQTKSVEINADITARLDFSLDPAPTAEPGSMYVWSISPEIKSYGPGGSFKDVIVTVTIKWDSDGNGQADDTDEVVSNARVSMRLTHTDTGDYWDFAGDTDSNGQVTFTLKFAPAGNYEAWVRDVTHDTLTYDSTLDVENPVYFTVS